MTALRFLSALVFLFIINWYQGSLNQISSATSKDWSYVLIIALIAGFLSLIIYYYGLQYTRASVATLCELAFPFSAVVVNWIFLGASLSVIQIIGGLVLLLAITRLTLINQQGNVEGI
jgi:drug/metabolite transporter (DMT)-like permease